MSFALSIFENINRQSEIAHYSRTLRRLEVENDNHGYGLLTAEVPMSQRSAWYQADRLNGKHVDLSNGVTDAFQGRIFRPAPLRNGLRIEAEGYWNAYGDVPYTALWSTKDLNLWRVMTADDISTRNSQKWNFEFTDLIQIGVKKNESYTDGADFGSVLFKMPDKGQKTISYIKFDLEYNLPTDWRFHIVSWQDDTFSTFSTERQIVGDGSFHSTTITEPNIDANRTVLELQVYNNTGGDVTITGDSGGRFVRISDIRVTSADGDVYGDEIVEALIDYMNAVNPDQINSSKALIQTPSVDLTDVIFEDEAPSGIMIDMADLGADLLRYFDKTKGLAFEVGVWEEQEVFFRPRGDAAQTWRTSALGLEFNVDLSTMYNSAYGVYKDVSGRTLRTATADNEASQAEYGIIRRDAVRVPTTGPTEAAAIRDQSLDASKDITPKVKIVAAGLFGEYGGAPVGFYLPRPGDTLIVENLPPTGIKTLDKFSELTIARTNWDVLGRRLEITPELEIPGLEFLVAFGEHQRYRQFRRLNRV